MTRVCHMTSAHDSDDIRIFVKECSSLAEAGYEVSLVACGGSRVQNGVRVVGCGEAGGRKNRMTKFAKVVYRAARELDCDIYHFHDPELLPYGIKLKKLGKKVIFDSHEDVSAQILDKAWIPGPLRKAVSGLYGAYETHAVRKFDAVVAATPHIGRRFEGRAKCVAVVNNYPRLDDVVFHEEPFEEREPIICYAGTTISAIRGERVMVEAMKGVEGTLVIAGDCAGSELARQCSVEGNTSVKYAGWLSRAQVNALYGSARAGIVVCQPAANYYDSQPIKLFEYMAAGLPVVASDFPLWKEIVEGNECGICVDPRSAEATREACKWLLNHPAQAQEMGRRGREAIEREYHWGIDSRALLSVYSQNR